ncbi:MAG: Sua5/YciO/YrdC/YwlC family protein [Pseudomonadota bacterium]
MLSAFQVADVVRRLEAGGLIAYPTEGVFGLGCLPSLQSAVTSLLALKRRPEDRGLILVAGTADAFDGWADLGDEPAALRSNVSAPTTWIVPAGPRVYPLLSGGRPTLAVRLTDFPVIDALTARAGEPLVSTSANLSGHGPIRHPLTIRRRFRGELDAIVPGTLGGASGPSEIRDLASGRVLRPRRA